VKPWTPTDEEKRALAAAIEAARQVQTFLWGTANGEWGLEEWLRMFRKRVAKLEEVKQDNPHAAVELKKRLLQTAALSVALIGIIDRDGVPWDAAPGAPPSNLPAFAEALASPPATGVLHPARKSYVSFGPRDFMLLDHAVGESARFAGPVIPSTKEES